MNQLDPDVALSTFLVILLLMFVVWLLSIVGVMYKSLRKNRPVYGGKFGNSNNDWKDKIKYGR